MAAIIPAGAEGTRNGIELRIAGLALQLTWAFGHLADEPNLSFYEPFLGAPGEWSTAPAARIRLRSDEPPDVTAGPLVFDARPNHWRLFRRGTGYAFEFFAPAPPHPRTQVAVLSSDFRSGELWVRPGSSPATPAWSLLEIMRPFGELLVINLLSHGRGAMLHALGVSDRGEGRLFVGASGRGKTTLANLYGLVGDATVLGDEHVVVTRADGRFWLSGTPWPGGGFHVAAETVPLHEIFFLEHGPRNELIAAPALTMCGLLLQQLFLPFWRPDALAFAMELTHALVGALPAHRLAFVNDVRVIEFLRSADARSVVGATSAPGDPWPS